MYPPPQKQKSTQQQIMQKCIVHLEISTSMYQKRITLILAKQINYYVKLQNTKKRENHHFYSKMKKSIAYIRLH